MNNIAPVLLIICLIIISAVGVVVSNSDQSDDLIVVIQDNFVKVTNVGDGTVEILDIAINDRKECAGFDLTAKGAILKIGDERLPRFRLGALLVVQSGSVFLDESCQW